MNVILSPSRLERIEMLRQNMLVDPRSVWKRLCIPPNPSAVPRARPRVPRAGAGPCAYSPDGGHRPGPSSLWAGPPERFAAAP